MSITDKQTVRIEVSVPEGTTVETYETDTDVLDGFYSEANEHARRGLAADLEREQARVRKLQARVEELEADLVMSDHQLVTLLRKHLRESGDECATTDA